MDGSILEKLDEQHQIVFLVWVGGVRRDKIKEKYGIDRQTLSQTERQIVKVALIEYFQNHFSV